MPVKLSGYLYLAGNLLLVLIALTDGNISFPMNINYPLLLSGLMLLVSGVFYARGKFQKGNRFSVIGSALLALDLFMSGQLVSSILILILHTGGKFLGSFPDYFERRFGAHKNIFLRYMFGRPIHAAGYGPMITRIPALAETLIIGDYMLALTFFVWFAADYFLTLQKFRQ